ncbi:hypothetical protein [Streptomyces sp. NPDC001492]
MRDQMGLISTAAEIVRSVAEPEGGAGDELDHAVDALAFDVAVSGVDERGDLGSRAKHHEQGPRCPRY